MSALSDISIRACLGSLASSRLRVEPFVAAQVQPCSLDLTLGPVLTIPGPGQSARIKTGELPERYTHVPITDAPHPLRPGESLLGCTAEVLTIPDDLVGLLVGRSTVARLFVAVEAAGLLDAGYTGRPTLEISNHGPHTVWLDAGIQIAQLLLLRLTTPVEQPYSGRYQADQWPTPARASKEGSNDR